jgi:hypothetical protein
MAIEPKTAKREALVFDQRTKQEDALFMKELAQRYPEAVKFRVVQDHLNTHSTSSFYETFSAEDDWRRPLPILSACTIPPANDPISPPNRLTIFPASSSVVRCLR